MSLCCSLSQLKIGRTMPSVRREAAGIESRSLRGRNLGGRLGRLSSTQTPKSPIPAPPRPAPPRFGRENSWDFPDPALAGIGKILGILARSRIGRESPGFHRPGKSGTRNPDLARIGKIAGNYASINRNQDRDRGSPGSHFRVPLDLRS